MPTSDSAPSLNNDLRQHILTAGNNTSRTKRWLWGFGLLILLGALFWLYLYNLSNDAQGAQYQTTPVTQGPLVVQVTATGTLQPLDQVEMSSETSGTVDAVYVEENDQVTADQVLLTLDTRTIDAQVKQAQANVAVAQAQLKQSQINLAEKKLTYQRKIKLKPNHYISDEDLNATKSAYLRAQADLQANQAQLLQSEAALGLQNEQLRKATIHAPFDGVVLSRQIDPGQTVLASLQAQVLFTLARDLTQMELLLDIDEADVGDVQAGQNATFNVDAFPDQNFNAQLTKVYLASETVDGVVTYKARLVVNNPDGKLRPGMSSTAYITVAKKQDVLLIPNTALRFEPPPPKVKRTSSVVGNLIPRPPAAPQKNEPQIAGEHVWILKNNQPVAIAVNTGLTDGIHTQILSGLTIDQAVITHKLDETKP